MTANDPIVIWALGALGAAAAWFGRHLDQRIGELEADIELLQMQMAGHDANKELLDRMYNELQELTKLTSRIAGHLNIN